MNLVAPATLLHPPDPSPRANRTHKEPLRLSHPLPSRRPDGTGWSPFPYSRRPLYDPGWTGLSGPPCGAPATRAKGLRRALETSILANILCRRACTFRNRYWKQLTDELGPERSARKLVDRERPRARGGWPLGWSEGFFEHLRRGGRSDGVGRRRDVGDNPSLAALKGAEAAVKYILDTNAVSALMAGDEAFIGRLKKQSKNDVYVPQPVLSEIAYGIERLPKSKRRESLQERYELIRSELQRVEWTDKVKALGSVSSRQYWRRRGNGFQDFDAAIAAHAHEPDAILVTANTDDMVRIPELPLRNWSEKSSTR